VGLGLRDSERLRLFICCERSARTSCDRTFSRERPKSGVLGFPAVGAVYSLTLGLRPWGGLLRGELPGFGVAVGCGVGLLQTE
jgi:hypothetical protein